MDFFEHIFEPHQERSELHHQELVREIRKLQKKEDDQDEYLKDHDARIGDLEKAVKIKN